MCMSKGVPKKPEFGPCQEQHSLNFDPKMLGEVMLFIGLMAPLVNLAKAYSNSTTAATLP